MWLKFLEKCSCGILHTAVPNFVTVYEPLGYIKSGELSYYVKSWTCTNLHSVGSILHSFHHIHSKRMGFVLLELFFDLILPATLCP